MSELLLRAQQLGKCYHSGAEDRWVFRNIDFAINEGQIISLTGPSGSGKSSLLNVLGLLTDPSEGKLFFKNKWINECSTQQKELFRSDSIGFVFQKHLLLPEFNLLENVCLPLAKRQGWSKDVLKIGAQWLSQFQLEHRAKAMPKELSGGEAQRGAIIRALIHQPSLLLLDEPTGNLDPQNSHSIIDHIFDHTKKNNCSVLLVTHNLELAKKAELKGHLKQEVIDWST